MPDIKITLAAARVNAGLTQEEAAKKIQVTKQTILNWEKGKVTPSFANVAMLSDIYGIPIEYIFLSEESTLSE